MTGVLLDLANDVSRGIIVKWLEPASTARIDSVLDTGRCYTSDKKSQDKLRWAMKRRLRSGPISLHPSVPEKEMDGRALLPMSSRTMQRSLHV